MNPAHVTNDDVAKEQRRARVAELYVRGYRQSEIARELGVSQPTIHRDIKAVRAEWLTSSVRDFNEAKEEELKKLDALEQEAWDAWRRSQTERTRTVTEKTEGDSSGRIKAQQTKETGYGDPRFLTVVQSCIDKRCKILGVEAPTRIDAKTEHTGVGFDEIVKMARDVARGQAIEGESAIEGEAPTDAGDNVATDEAADLGGRTA